MDADRKVNILLVDDRPENLLALAVTLERLGENLVTASSGREALKRLLEDEFAVILMDVQMPDMDGFETATLIRERDRSRHTPIIFITAISKTDTQVFKGYSVGAVDYIFKPIVPDILRSKVAVFADLFRKAGQVSRLNDALKRRTAELEAANEELRAFNYSVSHDLRSPLRAINGFAQILDRRYRAGLDSGGQHYLDNILRAGGQMDQQIEDLLAYSRLGHHGLRYQPVSVGDLLARVLGSLASKVEEQGAVVETAGDLPEVITCRRLLEQIMTNLIDNAITYHLPDVRPRIVVGCDLDMDSCTLSVRDNGIGVEPEDREKVFEVFYRAQAADRYPGTGIGLALVKKSADLMNGHVWLESVPGSGSTFFVRLPRVTPRGVSGLEDWDEPVDRGTVLVNSWPPGDPSVRDQ